MADEQQEMSTVGSNPAQGSSTRPEVMPNSPVINAMMFPWFMGVPWIPKFSGDPGKMTFSEWKAQVQAMLRAQGLNEEQKADFILGALEGDARREMQLLDSTQRTSSRSLLDELTKLYGKSTPLAQLRTMFFKCSQQEDETVAAFILRLRELFSRWRAHEPGGSAQDEMTARDQLVLGLRPGVVQQELQRQVRRNSELSFKEVCVEARALEAELRTEVSASRISAPHRQQATAPLEEEREIWRESVRAELKKEMQDQLSVLKETLIEEIRRQCSPQNAQIPSRDPTPPPRGRAQRGQHTPSPRRAFEWDPHGQPICRGCGKAGHIQRHCTEQRRQLNY